MQAPDILPNEPARLAALFHYDILDTPTESEFDDLAKMAADLCDVKIALISLVDQKRQWFKACVGLNATETPRNISFCGHAIHGDNIFEIPDAKQDERFADNPLVTGEPYIRFYAGQPLRAFDGSKLGTLCIIDPQPKKLTEKERDILQFLGQQVEKQLALKLYLHQSEQSLQLIRTQAEQLEAENKVRNQLISVLAHDLRSPIASLEGIVDAVDQEFFGLGEVLTLLQALRPELSRTSRQLTEVLQWIQQQMTAENAEMIPFSVQAIATKNLDWVKQRAIAKQVVLIKDVDPSLCAVGQPEFVNIIWRNLLSNAVKYSSRNDPVVLFAYRDQEDIVLGVRDHGLGMSRQTLESLQQNQHQASAMGTDNEQGTGLGLLLCHTYLQKMNCKLTIESELSQGSTFSFRLAAAPDPCLSVLTSVADQ